MADALCRVGATLDEHGRWHTPPGRAAPSRWRAVADAAAGRVLSRGDLIVVLVAARYTAPAAEALSIRHPLFIRVAPNRYRLVGALHPRPPPTYHRRRSPEAVRERAHLSG